MEKLLIRFLTPQQRNEKKEIIKKINNKLDYCAKQCKQPVGYYQGVRYNCPTNCEKLQEIRQLGNKLDENAKNYKISQIMLHAEHQRNREKGN